MAVMTIYYPKLEDSIQSARDARIQINNYLNEINNYVLLPLGNLSGADRYGNIAEARRYASNKISVLTQAAERFSNYSVNLQNFVDNARSKDSLVATRIESIADMYIPPRNALQQLGDDIYDFVFVDLLNSNRFLQTIGDAFKWVGNEIGNGYEAMVYFFKYGDGKNWANAIWQGIKVVGSIAGLIAAIVAIPVTGGLSFAAVGAIIGAVGAGISTALTIDDFLASSQSAITAQKNNSSPSLARYYSSIDSRVEYWDKNDMGNAMQNAYYKNVATPILNVTKKTAEVMQAWGSFSSGMIKYMDMDDTVKAGFGIIKTAYKFNDSVTDTLGVDKYYQIRPVLDILQETPVGQEISEIYEQGKEWYTDFTGVKDSLNFDYSYKKFGIDEKTGSSNAKSAVNVLNLIDLGGDIFSNMMKRETITVEYKDYYWY